MLSAFRGKKRKKKVLAALLAQKLISNDPKIAKEFLKFVELKEYSSNKIIIQQGDEDTNIYFIFSGSVNILVNKRLVATRVAGEHIGEMACLDPAAKRSATNKTTEKTTVGCISEENFSKLAKKIPDLWRRIAVELSERLKERGKFHSSPNKKPKVFIGCSKEALKNAKVILSGIDSKDYSIKIWSDGFFDASSTTIESLMKIRDSYDFGVIVFNGDDVITSRGKKSRGPRDNVIFELGLLMGALGRERTYIVKPEKFDIKIPSDLLGLTCYTFPISNKSAILDVSNKLMVKFTELGPR